MSPVVPGCLGTPTPLPGTWHPSRPTGVARDIPDGLPTTVEVIAPPPNVLVSDSGTLALR